MTTATSNSSLTISKNAPKKKQSPNSISIAEMKTITFFSVDGDDEMNNGKLTEKWLMELFSNMEIELMPCFFEENIWSSFLTD